MKKEYKEVCMSKDVYIASDNQEFLDASNCFDHEVDIGRWARNFIDDKAYYLLKSLKEFNEFKDSLEMILQQNIANDTSHTGCFINTNVYDSYRMSMQTRPSKFPCYVSYEFDVRDYCACIRIRTLTNILNMHKDTLHELHNNIDTYEKKIVTIQKVLDSMC